MVKEIIHDMFRLSLKSRKATSNDIDIANDLQDTLIANRKICVGLAANMIGENVSIITFVVNNGYMTMFNPEIIKTEGAYETEEGCLSLTGKRSTKRYKKIKVKFQTADMKWRMQSFEGYTAQIIQHEIDHCNGIII